MKDRLVANGVDLDLTEGAAFPLKFSINDLKNIKNRKRTYSQQISLPGTRKNRKFFSETYSLNSGGDFMNFNPNITTPVRYYKNGHEIISNGTLQLQSVVLKDNDVQFMVQVFTTGVDIFLSMGNMNIRDLDYSDLNHVLSRQAIKDSWTTPDGEGYRYPLIMYRMLMADDTWMTTDIVPYIHMVDLFKRIMDSVGQRYRSNFLTGQNMKNILFGFGGGDYINSTLSPQDIADRRCAVTGLQVIRSEDFEWSALQGAYGTPGVNIINSNNGSSVPIVMNNSYGAIVVTDVLNKWNVDKIVINEPGNYNLAFIANVSHEAWIENVGTGLIDMTLKNGKVIIQVNNNEVFSYDLITTTASLPNHAIVSESVNTGLTLNLNENDEVKFIFIPHIMAIQYTALGINRPAHYRVSTSVINLELTSIDTQVTDGDIIYINRFLPDMTCADFVMGMFRQFNLIMTDDDSEGIATIEPLIDFYQEKTEYEDITHWIDFGKEIEITPSSSLLTKNTLFNFKKRDEYDAEEYIKKWAEEYGDFELINNSHFSKSTEKIELPWSGIIPHQRLINGLIYPRFIRIEDNIIKPIRGSARIMYWNGMKSGEWFFRNTIDQTGEYLTEYPSVHHFDDWENPNFDLNFSLVKELFYNASFISNNNCYRLFYKAYYDEILSPHGKLLKANMKVNSAWIQSLDFSVLKMINGSLFRLNSVGSFDDNITESTPIELIRYINDYRI